MFDLVLGSYLFDLLSYSVLSSLVVLVSDLKLTLLKTALNFSPEYFFFPLQNFNLNILQCNGLLYIHLNNFQHIYLKSDHKCRFYNFCCMALYSLDHTNQV